MRAPGFLPQCHDAKVAMTSKMLHGTNRPQPSHASMNPVSSVISVFMPYWESFYTTLTPEQKMPEGFWKLTERDLYGFCAMILTTWSIWTALALTEDFNDILCYWDGPNYMFAAITMYDITRDNPWTKYFKYNPSYFACHLPGFPLVIRFFAFLFFGHYYVASLAAIIFCGLLLSYAFRRLLIAYKCVSSPTMTTVLLAFVPMRLVIYHSVGASEPLFIAEVCFVMIFYKYGMRTHLLVAVWACCITRIEGMAVGAAIGACDLLRLDIPAAMSMFLTFLAPIGLMIMHKGMFGDAFAYLTFNSGRQRLIVFPPFREMRGKRASDNANHLHSFMDFYFPYAFGALLVLLKAGPVGVFACLHLAYVSLLRHIDLYRYALPAGVFSVLIGFDFLWSDNRTKHALMMLAPFYWIEMMLYATGQIHSNKCPIWFLSEVLRAARDRLH